MQCYWGQPLNKSFCATLRTLLSQIMSRALANGSETDQDSVVEIFIKFDFEPIVCIPIPTSINLDELKSMLFVLFNVEKEKQRIIFKGRLLKEENWAPSQLEVTTARQPIHLISRERRPSQGAVAAAASDEGFSSVASSFPLRQLFSSSAFMERLLESDPKIQNLFSKHPEMKKALNNPETMNEMMQMMTNPEYQKHLQQSMDRALIGLNAMPGGQDTMRLILEMQKPLFEDLSNAGNPTLAPSLNEKNEREALPNPWKKGSSVLGRERGEIDETNLIEKAKELQEMGFPSLQLNLEALRVNKGNLEEAVEWLIHKMEE